MSKSFDARWERDCEREPGYTGRPRPVIALTGFGTVRSYIERLYGRDAVSKCSVCSRPSAAVRCSECQRGDARSCACGCYTTSDETACMMCGQERAA